MNQDRRHAETRPAPNDEVLQFPFPLSFPFSSNSVYTDMTVHDNVSQSEQETGLITCATQGTWRVPAPSGSAVATGAK